MADRVPGSPYPGLHALWLRENSNAMRLVFIPLLAGLLLAGCVLSPASGTPTVETPAPVATLATASAETGTPMAAPSPTSTPTETAEPQIPTPFPTPAPTATPQPVGGALLLSFILAVGINLARGRTDLDCGCFGARHPQKIGGKILVRNAVLMLLSLQVIIWGAVTWRSTLNRRW